MSDFFIVLLRWWSGVVVTGRVYARTFSELGPAGLDVAAGDAKEVRLRRLGFRSTVTDRRSLFPIQSPQGGGFGAVNAVFQRGIKLAHFAEKRLVILARGGFLLVFTDSGVRFVLDFQNLRIFQCL